MSRSLVAWPSSFARWGSVAGVCTTMAGLVVNETAVCGQRNGFGAIFETHGSDLAGLAGLGRRVAGADRVPSIETGARVHARIGAGTRARHTPARGAAGRSPAARRDRR